jgi:sulfatase modifying factor 1
MARRLVVSIVLHFAFAACGVERGHEESIAPVDEPAVSVAQKGAGDVAQPVEEPSPRACPSDMVLVEGGYCRAVQEMCAVQQDPRLNCPRYEPSVCLQSSRVPMRYCMDRYEWPNQKGELPRVLVSWQDARGLCDSIGKRLCTEDEFNFACEGEQMTPFVYGSERDPSQCNIDRPYRQRTFNFVPWDGCQADAACRAAFEAIDQRLPAGSMESCRSWSGAYDLNGNANEWVMLPNNRSPHRSGIKGGWWGPVRSRCRPTVTFHDEADYGYEVGFRCCADAKNPS